MMQITRQSYAAERNTINANRNKFKEIDSDFVAIQNVGATMEYYYMK
jgi:hypothetical protein